MSFASSCLGCRLGRGEPCRANGQSARVLRYLVAHHMLLAHANAPWRSAARSFAALGREVLPREVSEGAARRNRPCGPEKGRFRARSVAEMASFGLRTSTHHEPTPLDNWTSPNMALAVPAFRLPPHVPARPARVARRHSFKTSVLCGTAAAGGLRVAQHVTLRRSSETPATWDPLGLIGVSGRTGARGAPSAEGGEGPGHG